MSDKKDTAASAPAAGSEAKHTDAQLSAAVDQARKEAHAAGLAEGVKVERARIGAILNHAEAKGREASATACALETDLSPEQAAKLLSAQPKGAAAGGFLRGIDANSNPKVGADGSGAQEQTSAPAIDAAALFDARRKAAAAHRV